MAHDRLAEDLYTEICRIPLIDPHTHINPRQPTARTLDDLLGYHYYTELAHSAGLEKDALRASAQPRERVRAVLSRMSQLDNTIQYQWLLEIARAFFNFQDEKLTAEHSTWLWDRAERLLADPHWEEYVLRQANLEKVFLTNEFDDNLQGFDTRRYIPCLRTDDLLFNLERPETRQRLARATEVEVHDAPSLRAALGKLFDHFVKHGAKACAVSLPPDFCPEPMPAEVLSELLEPGSGSDPLQGRWRSLGVFWMLAEFCRDYRLPFDLMIGVSRRVYEEGVYQGQDLFDRRTSLIQYAPLFNAFPEVTFCVSVLSTGQNQELVSYSWIFPNVVTCGHWWYSNVPVYIERDLRARLEAVPKTKQIGYYSDMYKLEFALPKYNTYRRILAQVLADNFVGPQLYSDHQAISLARLLLRDNASRIFNV
jgi:glucuronate isomerase